MAKGDPKKPKGKMSAYAFFVQTCREEHKKKNPEVPVNFAEFSKKCSEMWKTIPGKEKSKFNEMAQADKVHCDPETKHHGPAKGGEKEDSNAPKRPVWTFPILLWIPPKDQVYKPWHLYWRCGKEAGQDVE